MGGSGKRINDKVYQIFWLYCHWSDVGFTICRVGCHYSPNAIAGSIIYTLWRKEVASQRLIIFSWDWGPVWHVYQEQCTVQIVSSNVFVRGIFPFETWLAAHLDSMSFFIFWGLILLPCLLIGIIYHFNSTNLAMTHLQGPALRIHFPSNWGRLDNGLKCFLLPNNQNCFHVCL